MHRTSRCHTPQDEILLKDVKLWELIVYFILFKDKMGMRDKCVRITMKNYQICSHKSFCRDLINESFLGIMRILAASCAGWLDDTSPSRQAATSVGFSTMSSASPSMGIPSSASGTVPYYLHICSVADPGCFFSDPGSEFIHPGSRVK